MCLLRSIRRRPLSVLGSHLSPFEGAPPLFLMPFVRCTSGLLPSELLPDFLSASLLRGGVQDCKCSWSNFPWGLWEPTPGVRLTNECFFIQQVISLTYIFYLIRFSLVAVSLLRGSLPR